MFFFGVCWDCSASPPVQLPIFRERNVHEDKKRSLGVPSRAALRRQIAPGEVQTVGFRDRIHGVDESTT